MLDDLEVGVDRTDNKLSDAMRRMRKFIRQTEGNFMISVTVIVLMTYAPTETKSGWCVIILVVILLVLLMAVILI